MPEAVRVRQSRGGAYTREVSGALIAPVTLCRIIGIAQALPAPLSPSIDSSSLTAEANRCHDMSTGRCGGDERVAALTRVLHSMGIASAGTSREASSSDSPERKKSRPP